ncbi:DUF6368 family protein [Streptomyces sp. URMC 126]|uniref:DUF6368 family protein n=1 Tax=Streptomyces sp. URMC 126 TaxID=3423401 RepID=UPI003F19890E
MGPVVSLWLGTRLPYERAVADALAWWGPAVAAVADDDRKGDGSGDGTSNTASDRFRVLGNSPTLALPTPPPDGAGPFFFAEDEDPAVGLILPPGLPAPAWGLLVGAHCSAPVDHLLLGHLALSLARRLGALVEFDGPLDGTGRGPAGPPPPPGVLYRVVEAADDGGGWYGHVGDAAFLAAWLRHPAFRLGA